MVCSMNILQLLDASCDRRGQQQPPLGYIALVAILKQSAVPAAIHHAVLGVGDNVCTPCMCVRGLSASKEGIKHVTE